MAHSERDIDSQFRRKNRGILQEKRGSGYWLWKPYFIDKALEASRDGDVVVYCDAGVEFVADPAPLLSLVSLERPFGLFAVHGRPIEAWTKSETIKRMGLPPDSAAADQTNGAFQVYYVCARTRSFVREYLAACCDRGLITDDLNPDYPNPPQFIDHRHDQSILSILAEKHAIRRHRDPSQFGDSQVVAGDDYLQILRHHRESITEKPFFARLGDRVAWLIWTAKKAVRHGWGK